MTRVVVLGGCGEQGHHTVRRLVESAFFDEIVVADINVAKARRMASELGPKVRYQGADAGNLRDLVQAMQGATVVVNEVGPYDKYGITAVRAALEARVNYVDINDDAAITRQIFLDEALKSRAEEAGITLIIGLGYSPGITNLLARLGADYLGQVEAIEVISLSDATQVGPASGALRVRSKGSNALVFANGAWEEVPPFSSMEQVCFGDLVDPVPVFSYSRAEVATLPLFIPGVRHVVMKHGYRQLGVTAFMQWVARSGLASEIPINVGSHLLAPSEFLAAYMGSELAPPFIPFARSGGMYRAQVSVSGSKDGHSTCVSFQVFGKGGGHVTGMPPQIAAELLAQGRIKAKGLLAPEALDPKPFLSRLPEVGLEVRTEYRKSAPGLGLK